MSHVWVFGYGSLVDPSSFGATIGRELQPGIDFHAAEVSGFGRRWNYGVLHGAAKGVGRDGSAVAYTRVALGVVSAVAESVNGVVGRVEQDELARLDLRERHYDRVDVSEVARVGGDERVDGAIVIYVPRPEAIEHYERARDRGTAAIEQRYWDLVDRAFAAFGEEARVRYHGTTPAPDVPVLPLTIM
jgi:cation transport regulator ChaC